MVRLRIDRQVDRVAAELAVAGHLHAGVLQGGRRRDHAASIAHVEVIPGRTERGVLVTAVVGARRLVDPRERDPARAGIIIQSIDQRRIGEPRARRITQIGGGLVGADMAAAGRVEAVERGAGVPDADTGRGGRAQREVHREHRALAVVGIAHVALPAALRACIAERRAPHLRAPRVGLARRGVIPAWPVPLIGGVALVARRPDGFHMLGPQPLELLGDAIARLRRGQADGTWL